MEGYSEIYSFSHARLAIYRGYQPRVKGSTLPNSFGKDFSYCSEYTFVISKKSLKSDGMNTNPW